MGAAHRCSSSETTVMYSEESVPEGALIVMYRKETYFLYGNQCLNTLNTESVFSCLAV
jgi:hypothetical protein